LITRWLVVNSVFVDIDCDALCTILHALLLLVMMSCIADVMLTPAH